MIPTGLNRTLLSAGTNQITSARPLRVSGKALDMVFACFVDTTTSAGPSWVNVCRPGLGRRLLARVGSGRKISTGFGLTFNRIFQLCSVVPAPSVEVGGSLVALLHVELHIGCSIALLTLPACAYSRDGDRGRSRRKRYWICTTRTPP